VSKEITARKFKANFLPKYFAFLGKGRTKRKKYVVGRYKEIRKQCKFYSGNEREKICKIGVRWKIILIWIKRNGF
jgi:hypothetical protein